MRALCDVLADRPYPGRGCLVARTVGGELVFGYFLTGRSDASHARQVVVLDSGDVDVRSTAGASDDALRHYVAAVRRGRCTVVGNGDQVEVIAGALAEGTSVADAAVPHSFEPDPPIFTSRIWLIHEAGSGRQHIGSAQRSNRTNGAADRVTWTIDGIEPGEGVLMTTYRGTAEQLTRTVHPVDVAISAATPEELTAEIWTGLRTEVRVATFAITPDQPARAPVVLAER